MINVLVIEPGSWVATPRQVEPKLEDFQQLVGGRIEALSLADDVSAYINEEGKFEDLPRNDAADRFVKHALHQVGRMMIPGDFVAGPLVITGQPDDDGYDTSAPERARELLGEVGIRVGEPGTVAVEVTVPDGPIPSRVTGREQRVRRSQFQTSIPQVVLRVSTMHSKERRVFSSIALGVRELPSDGIFSSELSAPLSSMRIAQEPVARFSQKALAEAHERALLVVRQLLVVNPATFDGVLLATPQRD